MKKIVNISIGIIIVILLAIGIFFLYQKFSSSTETLSHYLPAGTQYYLEIDLSDSGFRENLEKNQEFKKYFFDYLVEQGISEHILELDKNSIIGLAGVELFEKQEKIWIVENKNISKIETLLPSGYFFAVVDKQVGVLSSSFDMIQIVKEKAKEIQEQKSNSKGVNLLNYPAHGFITKDYFLSNNWIKPANKIPTALILPELDLNEQITFGLNLSYNSLFLDIKIGNLNTQNQAVGQLFNYIPKLEHVISVNSVNLSSFLDILLNTTTSIEEAPNSDINLTQYLAKKFGFSWYELRQTMDKPSLLVMSNKKNQLKTGDLSDLSEFNYAFVMNNLDQNEQNQIIQIYKNVLAFNHPTTTTKTLPDKSQITELVADPDNIVLSSQQVDLGWGQKVNVYYYPQDQNNFFFAGINQDFILANSKELILAIIQSFQADKYIVIDGLLNQCNIPEKNQIILFNPNLIESNFLSLFTQGLFSLDDQGIEGCWKIR